MRILLLIIPLLMAGCGPSTQAVINIAGSTSVQPIAEALAIEYQKAHPGIVINVVGGGSTAGIQAVREGAAQIGTSSRALKAEESDLIGIEIANDDIAVIVNSQNPLKSLSLIKIRKIFDGEITNWKQVGGKNRPIIVVTREEGSGTRGAFEDEVMQKRDITENALVQDSNGAVRETILGNRDAIGYISAGMMVAGVKVLKTEEQLLRPFLFVFTKKPAGQERKFLDFILSAKGQDLVRQEGYQRIK